MWSMYVVARSDGGRGYQSRPLLPCTRGTRQEYYLSKIWRRVVSLHVVCVVGARVTRVVLCCQAVVTFVTFVTFVAPVTVTVVHRMALRFGYVNPGHESWSLGHWRGVWFGPPWSLRHWRGGVWFGHPWSLAMGHWRAVWFGHLWSNEFTVGAMSPYRNFSAMWAVKRIHRPRARCALINTSVALDPWPSCGKFLFTNLWSLTVWATILTSCLLPAMLAVKQVHRIGAPDVGASIPAYRCLLLRNFGRRLSHNDST
jgi:hypothetical protein